MKVYCSRCKFYVPGYTIPYSFGPPDEQKEKCMSPDNFYDMYVSEKARPKSTPQIINRFNNCKWYEPKDWEPTPSSSSSEDSSSSSGDCSSSSICDLISIWDELDTDIFGQCESDGCICRSECENKIEF